MSEKRYTPEEIREMEPFAVVVEMTKYGPVKETKKTNDLRAMLLQAADIEEELKRSMGNITFRDLLGILRGGQKVRLHAGIGNDRVHVWTMCREVSEFLKSETYGYMYGWPVKDVRTNSNESVLDVEFACFFGVSNT